MNKQERKANAALSNAYNYVSRINTQKQEVKKPVLPQLKPKVEPVKEKPKYNGERIGSAEIKKLGKGYFFVIVTCNGQRKEVAKRFKSVTKAQEWISKYV